MDIENVEFVIQAARSATAAYEAGYDCAVSGPNLTNCDFRLFDSSEVGRRQGFTLTENGVNYGWTSPLSVLPRLDQSTVPASR